MKRMVFAAVLLAGLACAASSSFAQAAPAYTADDVAVPTLVHESTACPSLDVSTVDLRSFAPFELSSAVQIEDAVELPAMLDADARSAAEPRSNRTQLDSAGCTRASA